MWSRNFDNPTARSLSTKKGLSLCVCVCSESKQLLLTCLFWFDLIDRLSELESLPPSGKVPPGPPTGPPSWPPQSGPPNGPPTATSPPAPPTGTASQPGQ